MVISGAPSKVSALGAAPEEVRLALQAKVLVWDDLRENVVGEAFSLVREGGKVIEVGWALRVDTFVHSGELL